MAEAKSKVAALPRALWYVGPLQAEIRSVPLAPSEEPDGVRVRTLFSAVSRGTERLVASGRVPEGERDRMRAPLQEGAFPFPVKYGYCAVGIAVDGPADLVGSPVFALHPHQDGFVAPRGLVSLVPPAVPPRRAVLAANMETALNAAWDAGIGPADRVVVVGGGVVGLLVAWLAGCIPGTRVLVVDPDPSREAVAQALGVVWAPSPPSGAGADVVVHASATAQGLAAAIACAGREATVLELSWYGEGTVPAPLGGAFHGARLRLVSSQVGEVSPGRRPRWTHAMRLAAALDLLADPRLDALVTEEVAFDDLPAAIPRILAPGAPGLVTVVTY